MSRVYFPNLYALRFFTSGIAILQHIVMWQNFFGNANDTFKLFMSHLANTCVVIFFVISGFLITHQLLEEKSATNTINIKKFYLRRMRRIWPVYYLVLILAFFILPNFDLIIIPEYQKYLRYNLYPAIFFCIFLLPNIACKIFIPNIYIGPTWTLGIEEPFYLIWPWVVKKSTKLIRHIIFITILCIVIKILLFLAAYMLKDDPFITKTYIFWRETLIEGIPTGSLVATIFFYRKEHVLKILYNKWFRLIIYIFAVSILISNKVFPFYYDLFAAIAAIFVLNMATNKQTLINLDNKVLNYLGKISYGYYMYHMIIIVLVIRFITGPKNVAALIILVYIFTLLAAILSYEFFESIFLGKKKARTTTKYNISRRTG